MAFSVFLSHSTDPEEQVIMWRLQTLAAAHGISVYVPQRPGGHSAGRLAAVAPAEVRQQIDRAEWVLAIITTRTSRWVEQELNYAVGRNKPVLPLVEAGVRDTAILRSFPRVFRFSYGGPAGQMETQVISFLKQQKASKEAQQALGALVAIGLGLLLLAELPKK